VFWVPSMVGPVMVAPRRYLPEIKSHPDLSFAAYLREALCGAQTGADGPFWSQRFVLVIKKNLTQSLSHVTAALSEEAVVALDRQLPSTEGEALTLATRHARVLTGATVAAQSGPRTGCTRCCSSCSRASIRACSSASRSAVASGGWTSPPATPRT